VWTLHQAFTVNPDNPKHNYPLQTQRALVALHKALDQCALQLAQSHRTGLSALQTEALQHPTHLGRTESTGTAQGET